MAWFNDYYSSPSYQFGTQMSGMADMRPDVESIAPAASGMALSNPAAAGIMMGGQFLSNLIAQKAADERNRRELMADAAKSHSASESNAMGNMMNAYRAALLR